MRGSPFEIAAWVAIGIVAALLGTAAIWFITSRRETPFSTSRPTLVPTALRPPSPEDNWPKWEITIRNALLQHGQVEESHLESVPPPLRMPVMRRYVEEHSDDALLFAEEPPRIELSNRARMKGFLDGWQAAWEAVESEERFEEVVHVLATQLCDILGFVYLSQEQRTYRHLHGVVVRAPALRLKIPPRFPLVFVRRREGSREDLTDLRNLMSILDMTSYFALIIDLNDSPDQLDPRRNPKVLFRDTIHDFIVLNGRDLRQIAMARDPAKRLVDVILQQVDLTVVSPYVTSGPVPKNMFYGRDHELKTITRKIRDTSFALIGGRKIGKTSLLTRLYRLLAEGRDPNQVLYMDCQSVTSADAFYEAANTLWGPQPLIHSPEDLRRFIVVQQQGQWEDPFIILLDEIDTLLSHDLDQGEPIFRMFRALSQEGRCRFVFCGERVLHDQLHAPDSPLFNFCDVIQLGHLGEHAARRIILEPMQTMSISIQNHREVASEIVRLSSCHPNLVQYLCQQLILEANARHSRLISRTDLDKVRHSSSFQEYFLEVTWGNSSPLEQAITLLIMDRHSVSFGQIQELLEQHGLRVTKQQLERAMDGLRLYCILIKEGRQYRLASEVFGEIVHESQEIDILLASLRDQIARDRAEQLTQPSPRARSMGTA